MSVDKFVWIYGGWFIPLYDMSNTQSRRKLYKSIKGLFNLTIDERYTVGVVKISRIKVMDVKSWRSDDIVKQTVEMDVIYTGTINEWGRMMGPSSEVRHDNNERRWLSRWRSSIHRNTTVRREIRKEIMTHLKYFGIHCEYTSDLKIKKIVWQSE